MPAGTAPDTAAPQNASKHAAFRPFVPVGSCYSYPESRTAPEGKSMKENQESQAACEGVSPSVRAEGKPMQDAMRKHGPAIALATALLASYALMLNRISDLRADFRAGMTDLRQELRAEFERVDARFEHMDARFERMDARLYELIERVARIEGRVARIEGHLGLTQAPAAETSADLSPAAEQASLCRRFLTVPS